MSLISDILDRLSGGSQLKEKLQQQDRVIERMQQIMLEQQRDIAELKGTVKAMLSIKGSDRSARGK